MGSILIASKQAKDLEAFAGTLGQLSGLEVDWAPSGQEALDICAKSAPVLVVADEALDDMSALELASRLLMVNAFINTAVVSGLSAEDFHEESEGLGVLAQLSPGPSGAEAAQLWAKLRPLVAE